MQGDNKGWEGQENKRKNNNENDSCFIALWVFVKGDKPTIIKEDEPVLNSI